MAEENVSQENETPEPQGEQAPAEGAQPATPPAEKKPEQAPSRPAPEVPEGALFYLGTGRRKSAVARVRMKPGSGKIVINTREFEKYFDHEKDRQLVLSPLETANMVKSWDIWANVSGGGFTGQAGAVTLGIARAIARAVPEVESSLRDSGLLTRDARAVERKKYGQKGARKRFQFSKR
jgi:small subunit ribosomal protein S9